MTRRNAKKPAASKHLGTKAGAGKREAFIREYLIDENATQAAIRAGYSPRTAGQQGYRLLKDAQISTAIEQARSKVIERISDRYEVTTEKLIHSLAVKAFGSMADYIRVTPDGDAYVDLSACDRDQLTAIQEVKVEDVVEGRDENQRTIRKITIKLYDSTAAAVHLLKMRGEYGDKAPDDPNARSVGSLIELLRSLTQRNALPIGSQRLASKPLDAEHSEMKP